MYNKRNADKLGGCVNICRHWLNIWEGIAFEFQNSTLEIFYYQMYMGERFCASGIYRCNYFFNLMHMSFTIKQFKMEGISNLHWNEDANKKKIKWVNISGLKKIPFIKISQRNNNCDNSISGLSLYLIIYMEIKSVQSSC